MTSVVEKLQATGTNSVGVCKNRPERLVVSSPHHILIQRQNGSTLEVAAHRHHNVNVTSPVHDVSWNRGINDLTWSDGEQMSAIRMIAKRITSIGPTAGIIPPPCVRIARDKLDALKRRTVSRHRNIVYIVGSVSIGYV